MKHKLAFRVIVGLLIVAVYIAVMLTNSQPTGYASNGVTEFGDYFFTLFFTLGCIVVLLVALMFPGMVDADRRRYEAYYAYIEKPAPGYRIWYMWGNKPYKDWKDAPGGLGWKSMDRFVNGGVDRYNYPESSVDESDGGTAHVLDDSNG